MSLLGNLLGGGRAGGGMSPITLGLLGLLAYRTFQGKGRLADMLGQSQEPAVGNRAPGSQGQDNQAGFLGGLLGGGAGSILSGGLGDLLKSFQQNGQGDKAETWVAKGANAPISQPDLAQALGPDKIAWLMRETGMSREELLEGLSRELPEAVDELTPQGRLPTEQEAARWTSAKWT